jgi:hypothetical protein
VNVERLGVADIVGAPHAIDERVPGEHATGVLQQQLEQLELLQRQRHGFAPDQHLVTLRVEDHVADLECLARQLGRFFHGRATQDGADPGYELAQPVGLGDVVVGADLEADDSVELGPLRGDHDHRHLALRPQLAAHVDARQLRQHHVEQHEVGAHGVEQRQRFGAVTGDVHSEAFALQSDGQRVDEGVLVFDDQDRRVRRSH